MIISVGAFLSPPSKLPSSAKQRDELEHQPHEAEASATRHSTASSSAALATSNISTPISSLPSSQYLPPLIDPFPI
jgi:hypothetical protein